MEDILGGGAPTDDDVCYETTEALAEPLLACYWSLWECGSGIVAEGTPCTPFMPESATQNRFRARMHSGPVPSQFIVLYGLLKATMVTSAPYKAFCTSHSARCAERCAHI